MEAAAASSMDFHALSRRELQALCKRNGVRANMTNAAMAEALQGLTSVDGIDEIGSTLCLPTPGRSTMKSAAKAAALAGEEQQQGSPLPRGRRVSVMSPAAIRMDVEEGDDAVKRDLVKEIVKTPGVALRSTSRRARATPAPLPTPATLRRSQRTAARKAAAPVEAENRAEEVSTAKRTTRRASARSKMMVDLDQEEEVSAAAQGEEKVQQEEPKDVKCDDPEEEEEVTKLLEGNNKEEEPEEGEEADSSDAASGSAMVSDKSCDDVKVEEVAAVVEQEASTPHEGTVKEQEPISVEKSTPLAPMEDSPILGVLSKAEATESVIGKAQDATAEDDEGVDEWSPVSEMSDDISPVGEVAIKEAAVGEEAIKEDGFTVTGDTVHSPKEILPAAAADVETSEEDDLVEDKEGTADEMPQAELIEGETSEEDDVVEEKEGPADEMPQAELTEEISEGGELDEDDEWSSDDDEASEEINSTDYRDEENIEINEEGCCIEVTNDFNDVKEVLVHMIQKTAIAEEAGEDSAEESDKDDFSEEDSEDDTEEGEDGSAEEDDFTNDLSPEFNNIVVLSDAETDSDTTPPVLEENQAVDSSVTKEEEVSEMDTTEEAVKEVADTVDTTIKSLDDFTIKEGTQQTEEEKINTVSEAEGSKVRQKGPHAEDYNNMSVRQLRAKLRDRLSAKKEGNKHAEAKRLPLEEVDDNARADC